MTFGDLLSQTDVRFLITSIIALATHFIQYNLFLSGIAENIKNAKNECITNIKTQLKKIKKPAPDEILDVHKAIHNMENNFEYLEEDVISNHNTGISFALGTAAVGIAPLFKSYSEIVTVIGGLVMIVSAILFGLSLKRLLNWNINYKLGKHNPIEKKK